MAKARYFTIELENSSERSISFRARIRASSKKMAVERLQNILPSQCDIFESSGKLLTNTGNEFIRVFFNHHFITLKNFEEEIS